ncbi:PREDICTED: uncharacterized protein LOC108773621 [Cyphomyrmex costatus]|uniref:uncharacterized protein LOC108773621 n=1 Tax=Cyphomyrmex costatus TaxID=456900 RepID=UPI0008523341|nr:PREDICTED: uncharacterized protein LOC108773621 [Cyphomyrmex costatus]
MDTDPQGMLLHEQERANFEKKYFEITAELVTLIEQKESVMPSIQSNFRHVREGTPVTQGSIVANEYLKLPRVDLPTFSGNLEEWMLFRNMFKSMIDQNAALPKVQKMQYLISALKDEAREVISSLEASEENYIEAWEMLRMRYDDPALIIQKHIRALFELPAMVKESHSALRQLLDSSLKHLRALKALKRPTEAWDDLVVYLLTSRLDQKTNRAWKTTIKPGELPTFDQLINFLSQYCRALEASARTQRTGSANTSQIKGTASHVAASKIVCAYCGKADHAVYNCSGFLKLEVDKRIEEVRSRKLCLNCLKGGSHRAKQCGSRPCKICSKRHNTLLHLEQKTSKTPETKTENSDNSKKESLVAISSNHVTFPKDKCILLATATVDVIDANGNKKACRALLDSGSQSCFITNSFAKALKLKQFSTNIPICGLGEMYTRTHKYVKIRMQSKTSGYEAKLNCFVMESITQPNSVKNINPSKIKIPKGIKLADPEFYKASKVDFLIGAEIFFDIMCIGRIKKTEDQPLWQKTLLGWIVAGNLITSSERQEKTICNLSINEQINAQLARFWQIEHNERQNTRSPEERKAEEHFMQTYQRNEEGRFIVSLPTKEDLLKDLGKSKDTAIQRFKGLEKRLAKNEQLRKEYTAFIHEYLELQHMRVVQEDGHKEDSQQCYYLPHHGVVREGSSITRLRVVFDASSKTSTGVSLNDALMIGPVIQQDLFSILLRFRSHAYAVTADIAKMYRQVLITENQVALQRIVWRDTPNEDIKTYELMTLTYGTAPASFLATKVIQRLAELEENQFPRGALIAARDLYMDDLITGADSKEEASKISIQTAALLRRGGFVLRKWASNDKEILKGVPEASADNLLLELNKESTTKTLGIKWNTTDDVFQYSIAVDLEMLCTKRAMISSTAKIFDPLGLVAPIIIIAKILIQKLLMWIRGVKNINMLIKRSSSFIMCSKSHNKNYSKDSTML